MQPCKMKEQHVVMVSKNSQIQYLCLKSWEPWEPEHAAKGKASAAPLNWNTTYSQAWNIQNPLF